MDFLPWEPDRRKPVYARSGWEIPLPDHRDYLAVLKDQTESNVLQATGTILGKLERNNKRVLRVRSVSHYMYNCVGMVFSNRRAWIEIDEVHNILTQDGYVKIQFEHLEVGDIVVYTRNKPEHVGLITDVLRRGGQIENARVLSKWGKVGEMEHYLNVVPDEYGLPTEYWSERKPYVAR